MTAQVQSVASGEAGWKAYTPQLLSFYDVGVLSFSNRFIWRCPSSKLLALYSEHLSANHLEVGAGTGYFLARSRFPTASPRVVLFDANPNCLEHAARKLSHLNPETHQGNLLEPLTLPPHSFDSIAINLVLHCVPGTMAIKGEILRKLAALLRPGGVLFGSTILARGVPHGFLSRRVLASYNRIGTFSNAEDDAAGLEAELARTFPKHRFETVGTAGIFVGHV